MQATTWCIWQATGPSQRESIEVEGRLAFLTDEAKSAIAASSFDEDAKALLEDVTRKLTDRGS